TVAVWPGNTTLLACGLGIARSADARALFRIRGRPGRAPPGHRECDLKPSTFREPLDAKCAMELARQSLHHCHPKRSHALKVEIGRQSTTLVTHRKLNLPGLIAQIDLKGTAHPFRICVLQGIGDQLMSN